MLKRATKEDLLGCKPKSEDVELPSRGLVVTVRGLRGFERDAFETAIFSSGEGDDAAERKMNTQNVRARLVSLCAVNEDGTPMFTEEEVQRLGEIDAGDLDVLYSVAQRLSGLRKEDLDEARKP